MTFTTFPSAREVRQKTIEVNLKKIDDYLNDVVKIKLNKAIKNKKTSFEILVEDEEKIIELVIDRLIILGYRVTASFIDVGEEVYKLKLTISFEDKIFT